ncbi:hypothetical protein GE253_20855 [Niveispirillum sp. SYP-B3756]|uniref:hypothetical protein n=1 Tax=Niveispirillum sp. SYP-B3756 TaxID=2662178 RepID=UPI001290D689|nr:hypothetical protein [Niveispirillum sp. SYP-B3756]MQP67779.1 hypothetical protein [Niveispirillum sp. SYP-B3756]
MSMPSPAPFVFRWRDEAGQWTEVNCWAASRREAEIYASRAGWPGHDGTRLGRYRAWLEQTIKGTDEN